MPEIKHYGQDNNDDLKHQDSEKGPAPQSQIIGGDKRSNKKSASESSKKNRPKNKRDMPIAVDILIAVLILAMVGGIIAGGYYLFRYFSNDYEEAEVTYLFVVPAGEFYGELSVDLIKNKNIYLDGEGNTYSFGEIKECKVSDENGALLIEIAVSVRYESENGYFIGEEAIAVGKDFALRVGDVTFIGTVAELTVND